jgi:hypothetical protein
MVCATPENMAGTGASHLSFLFPVQQVVKCCGVLLDSRETPCLRVPVSKREPALAIADGL